MRSFVGAFPLPLGLLLVLLATANSAAATDPAPQDLPRTASAILAKRCLECHGAKKQEGGLRLDDQKRALQGGDSGKVIEPGKADKSLLIEYVRGSGDTVMPPSGPRLTADEVATLRAWIDRGATWPENQPAAATSEAARPHWSFQPVKRPAEPNVKNAKWVRNPIDRFVLARLESEHVTPSPEADRATLIRRLSLDLLGLPPSPDEVSAFVADKDPRADAKLVERLLASPHFGERWGRHWLDRARFGESSGCVIDLIAPYAWRWRDWVIEAVNRDLPFDRFTLEQLAGDLLPNPTVDQLVAAGFQRNALSNHEDGIDLEAERAKAVIDRTVTVGTAWMGLTLGCAECHSHKYDPIPHRDFYRLYAFFDSLEDREIDAPPTADAPAVKASQAKFQAARVAYLAATVSGQAAWEKRVAALGDVWSTPQSLENASLRTRGHGVVRRLDDGSLRVDGPRSASDSYLVAFPVAEGVVRAIRVEVLDDPDRFHRGPGNSLDQEAQLSGILVQTGPQDPSAPVHDVPLAAATADYCQPGFQVADTLLRNDKKGWALDHVGLPHAAVFTLREAARFDKPGRMLIKLEQESDRFRTLIRFRVAISTADGQTWASHAVPQEIVNLARTPAERRSDEQRALLRRYYQAVYEPASASLAAWNAALDSHAKIVGAAAAHTIRQCSTPRETFVHLRGDFRRHGDRVEPGFLEAFAQSAPGPVASQKLTRLDLARWLVQPSHPLTARVAVNDIWQHLFGLGLVRTANDFGRQGDPPTHPELLDWLADELVRQGWSRKAMIRLIVGSAAYRQASALRRELNDRDPKNLLLARQNRVRLEAEVLRDAVLECGGQLDHRLGGPGFRMPQPMDDLNDFPFPADRLSAVHRRGLYAIAKRTLPDPLFITFDAPEGTAACPLRQRTNTPIQALCLLNDPLFVDAARRLASNVWGESGTDLDARISRLFARCLARGPTAVERKVLTNLFQAGVAEYASRPADAAQLAGVAAGEPRVAEAAAWYLVARTVLNLDEMITRE